MYASRVHVRANHDLSHKHVIFYGHDYALVLVCNCSSMHAWIHAYIVADSYGCNMLSCVGRLVHVYLSVHVSCTYVALQLVGSLR